MQLEFACRFWTASLHDNARLQGTHDLGFMITPWARPAATHLHDAMAQSTLKQAAETLAARFSPVVGLMRSWDTCVTRRYRFVDPENEFLTIIDNMMNLDLVFHVAWQTGDRGLRDLAIQHARTTQRTHVRENGSTFHLVLLDPKTGSIKQKLTNQGYADVSCWARGQAWAIAGFAETYAWTLDAEFLATALRCADYFVSRLPETMIPPWDFDAPTEERQPPDTSAALIAAYGMLLLHQALQALGRESRYLVLALEIVDAVCRLHLNPRARFVLRAREKLETVEGEGTDPPNLEVEMGEGETIVNGATINNYEFAPRRWADHGLVYADYFFLLVGNTLLDMGTGALILKMAGEAAAKVGSNGVAT
jgi:hypothetical protein